MERCIGVLKKRFRCLLRYRTLEYAPEKAAQIINACTVLHNMCIQARLPDPPEPAEHIMALEHNNENEIAQPLIEGRALFNQGQRMRDQLARRL